MFKSEIWREAGMMMMMSPSTCFATRLQLVAPGLLTGAGEWQGRRAREIRRLLRVGCVTKSGETRSMHGLGLVTLVIPGRLPTALARRPSLRGSSEKARRYKAPVMEGAAERVMDTKPRFPCWNCLNAKLCGSLAQARQTVYKADRCANRCSVWMRSVARTPQTGTNWTLALYGAFPLRTFPSENRSSLVLVFPTQGRTKRAPLEGRIAAL